MFATVLVKYVMPDLLSPTTYSHDSKLGFKGLCEEVSEPDNVNPLLTKFFIKGITSTNVEVEISSQPLLETVTDRKLV